MFNENIIKEVSKYKSANISLFFVIYDKKYCVKVGKNSHLILDKNANNTITTDKFIKCINKNIKEYRDNINVEDFLKYEFIKIEYTPSTFGNTATVYLKK